MESREQEVLDEIAASVVNDYYSAAVKWEVVLDALLTPVIADLLSAMTGEGFAYITKEFPIQNQKAGLQSAKAFTGALPALPPMAALVVRLGV